MEEGRRRALQVVEEQATKRVTLARGTLSASGQNDALGTWQCKPLCKISPTISSDTMTELTAETPSVQSVIQVTENLFQPALSNREDLSHITSKLLAPRPVNDASRIELLNRAGTLLQSLHSALQYERSSPQQGQAYDSSLLLALYKLLDFLLLEGVYPSLPAGVGLLHQARAKSLFYRRHDPSYKVLPAGDQSGLVLSQLIDPLLNDVDAGIEPLLRHRVLSDIIAGNAWLAHCNGNTKFLPSFSSYLERLVLNHSSYNAYMSITDCQLRPCLHHIPPYSRIHRPIGFVR
jgi:hypothetical protein